MTDTKKKLIPNNILQISLQKPEPYVINYINKFFPGWNYYHFNDEDILSYLSKNKIEEFPNCIEKFHSFPIGAWKADFFRYYFLYLNGGVFLDSDAMPHCNIDDIIQDNSAVFIKSNFFEDHSHLFNGFICIGPKHPIIYDALKHIYDIHIPSITTYQIFCNELLNILIKYDLSTIKIYQETIKKKECNTKSDIFYKGKKILTHYFQNKVVPKYHCI